MAVLSGLTTTQMATELVARLNQKITTSAAYDALNRALMSISQVGTLSCLMERASITTTADSILPLASGSLPADMDKGKATKVYLNAFQYEETTLDELITMTTSVHGITDTNWYATSQDKLWTLTANTYILVYQKLPNKLGSSPSTVECDLPVIWHSFVIDMAEYEMKAQLHIAGWEEARVRAMERLKMFIMEFATDKKDLNVEDLINAYGLRTQ